MAEDEKTCRCPKCNCFSGLVHIPIEGEYFVSYGKVTKVYVDTEDYFGPGSWLIAKESERE